MNLTWRSLKVTFSYFCALWRNHKIFDRVRRGLLALSSRWSGKQRFRLMLVHFFFLSEIWLVMISLRLVWAIKRAKICKRPYVNAHKDKTSVFYKYPHFYPPKSTRQATFRHASIYTLPHSSENYEFITIFIFHFIIVLIVGLFYSIYSQNRLFSTHHFTLCISGETTNNNYNELRGSFFFVCLFRFGGVMRNSVSISTNVITSFHTNFACSNSTWFNMKWTWLRKFFLSRIKS